MTYVIFQADPRGYLCIFLFVLLIATAASVRISQILFGSLILSGLYLFVHITPWSLAEHTSVGHLMVFPVFYAAGLYFGYQVLQIRGSRAQVDLLYRERQELKILLNILESITSTLDFHSVMYEIASRIGETIEAIRCSILLVEQKDAERAFVVAANDDRKLRMLPVDLAKYPEVLSAIQTKQAVIIEEVEKSEMMRAYLEDLRRLNFCSPPPYNTILTPQGNWLAVSCGYEVNQTLQIYSKTCKKWVVQFKDYVAKEFIRDGQTPMGTLYPVRWTNDELYLYFRSTVGISAGGTCFYGGWGQGLYRLKIENGTVLATLPPLRGGGLYIFSFSPSGRWLAYTRSVPTILDLRTG